MTPSEESYRLIPLTKGQFAIVDPEDFPRLSAYRWHAFWDTGTRSFRARRSAWIDGRNATISMARDVMGVPRGDRRRVDHESHDTLDNRRSNLRVCSHAQNTKNKKQHIEKLPKGIALLPSGSYQARIMSDGNAVYLGSRRTLAEAKALYDDAARRLHGDFARFS